MEDPRAARFVFEAGSGVGPVHCGAGCVRGRTRGDKSLVGGYRYIGGCGCKRLCGRQWVVTEAEVGVGGAGVRV